MTAANPSPDNALRECLVRVSDWLTAALDCPRFLWDGDQHDAATHARDEAAVALSSSPASEALGSALRVALEEVRDLLTEKIYGNPARSPAHNARVKLDTAIASLPAALSASAGGGWLPIEIAPKDAGAMFLVLTKSGQIAVAKVKAQWTGFYSVPGEYSLKATHWQPLPQAPRS